MKKIEHEISSGNIFKDLELKDSEELKVKADLALMIIKRINAKKLSQKQAAKLLGTSQPRISNIFKGQIQEFTVDRLIKMLRELNYSIEITVKPTKAKIPFFKVA